jgi:LemA protein
MTWWRALAQPLQRARRGLRSLVALGLATAALGLSGCGYNEFQRLDEESNAAWAEVLSQYQRRADLIPNIVNTVKGEANFEQETLTKVVEARAKATSIQVTPELARDPQALQRFQAAQGELSGALSRLLMVTENYPNLKANQGFQDLRVQLEGTENRITVARNRYIKSVQAYNVHARQFPSNLTAMVFSYSPKPNFTVENEAAIKTAPAVNFDKPAAPSSPAAAASR